MFRDIFFILVVFSITISAHSNKNEIMHFMEVAEEEEESFLEDEVKFAK